MAYLEYLLWAYFIVNPIYIYMTCEQEKQSVINQPEKRVAMYRGWMLHLWVPVLILMLVVNQSDVSLADLGLQWHWSTTNLMCSLALLMLCGYFLISLRKLKDDQDQQHKLRQQLDYMQWMAPTTRRETQNFALGLSLSAGICEEILFRGYLMYVLAGYFPTYAVVLISSIAFGLPHIYQGPIHIIRTAIVGATMALIYVFTDSIIIPILLHALLDMYGGVMAYIVFSKEPQSLVDENT